MLETLHEEVVVTVSCTQAAGERAWSARADLTASSSPGVVLAGVAKGASRSKAAAAAVEVAMAAWELRRPKRRFR